LFPSPFLYRASANRHAPYYNHRGVGKHLSIVDFLRFWFFVTALVVFAN